MQGSFCHPKYAAGAANNPALATTFLYEYGIRNSVGKWDKERGSQKITENGKSMVHQAYKSRMHSNFEVMMNRIEAVLESMDEFPKNSKTQKTTVLGPADTLSNTSILGPVEGGEYIPEKGQIPISDSQAKIDEKIKKESTRVLDGEMARAGSTGAY